MGLKQEGIIFVCVDAIILLYNTYKICLIKLF